MGIFSGATDLSTPLFVQGLNLIYADTATQQLTYTAGSARSLINDFIIEYPQNIPNVPGFITLDLTTVGPNGCFPLPLNRVSLGSVPGILPVLFIGSSSGTTNGSLNPNATLPALMVLTDFASQFPPLPSGYDCAALVGYIVVTSSHNLLPFTSVGQYNERTIVLDVSMPILTAGHAASPTGISIPNLFASSSSVKGFYLNYSYTTAANTDSFYLGYRTATVSEHFVAVEPGVTSTSAGPIYLPSQNTQFYYSVSNVASSLNISISGFDFEPLLFISS